MNAAPEEPARRDSMAWRRVAERTGIAPELLVTPGLDRWIEDRARMLDVDSVNYVDRLLADETERRLFASQIAVPESWIGRYPASMDAVRDLAVRIAARGGVFRAISLGCAAGQELFSVVLAARDAGLPDHRLELHGVDRNPEAIARARSGLLPTLAVRSDLPASWRSSVVREPDGWRIADDLRALVRFHEADLLHDPWPIDPGSADLVLCRNVLIYLDPQARRTLVERAASLLSPDGLLLAGHADPPADLRNAFRPVEHPGAFAWRPIAADASSSHPSPIPRTASFPPRSPIVRPTRRHAPSATPADPTPEPPSLDLDHAVLAEIRRAADGGDLDGARARAKAIAGTVAPNADLESLLGEIASADGRSDDARAHWRRALYLDADHAATLVHLAFLSESLGDAEAAAAYRRRLERLGIDTEFES